MGAVVHTGVSDAFEGYEIFKKYSFSGIKLGAGTTSQVHEAMGISSGTTFAVKIIVKEEAQLVGKSKDLLHKEANIMRQLRHPNICQFHELFEDKDLIYFVFELCDGGTLFDKLEYDLILEENVAKKFLKGMLRAVAHLHDKGYIHRDLRPENWMLSDWSDKAEIKLANCGMCVECQSDTRLSQPCGTLHYVAPEVLRGDYGRPSDVWTIGVVLFLILYGSYPFDGDSAREVMTVILISEPAWGDSCQQLSSEVKNLLKGLLDKEPSRRLPIEVALRHPWVPKGNGLSRQSSHNRMSTMGSFIPKILQRHSVSSRCDQVVGIRRANDAAPPSVPELKGKPGQARRQSNLVTSDLINSTMSRGSMTEIQAQVQSLLEGAGSNSPSSPAKSAKSGDSTTQDDSSDNPSPMVLTATSKSRKSETVILPTTLEE